MSNPTILLNQFQIQSQAQSFDLNMLFFLSFRLSVNQNEAKQILKCKSIISTEKQSDFKLFNNVSLYFGKLFSNLIQAVPK